LFESAAERTRSLLARLADGTLFRRFLSLGPRALARELPVLLPPDDSAVGYVSGAVDLVYRDESGRLVVADYKTDRLEGESDLAERAAVYAPQEALYARALQEALGLDRPPHTELWFLWPDRLWPSS
jgi:ATP-dependent exoDNAse (exonuclease V) beta subunit